MNKHIVKYLLVLATIAFAGGGCNVDDYNEEYLDGFNPDKEITDVQVLKYTMTDADYASVASNAANKAIAEAAGPDAVAALAAVGTAKCFSEAASATTYLPAFLAAGYDSYLSNGSTVTVTYKNATDLAEEVVKLAAAETYTVSGADYQSVWGETPANYFTPEKPLAGYANKILTGAYPDAEAGAIKVVAYNYSASEPNTGGGETPAATSIDETFDGGLNAWQIVKGSSTSTWSLDDYNGVKSAKCSAFNTTGPQDLWLISEKVNLTLADNPQLAFDVKISYWTHDGLSVLVSTDYNGVTPEEATWIDLTNNFTFDGSTSGKWYTAGICDMSAYKAESVYVAFRYQGNAADNKTTTYYIDNIQLGQDVVTVTDNDLFEETFDADNFDKWQLVKAAGEDNKQWAIKKYSENLYAQVSANGAAGAVESWLVSKDPITVPAFDDGMTTFGFDIKIGFWNANCLSILISENYTGDMTKATWTDITGNFTIPEEPASGYGNDFEPSGRFSLYKYAGKTLHFAFKYVGDGANQKTTTYQLDNIKVSSMKRGVAVSAAAALGQTRAVTQERYAVYTFNGTSWATAEATTIVNPEDYTQMGATNPNFSSSFSQDTYLPLYLKYKFPYAMPEDVMDVAYHFYASGSTVLQADRYTFDGSNWIKNLTYETLDGPFKKVSGKWNFDPSMTLVVAPDRSAYSKSFYQACVDWVLQNKDAAYTTDNRSGSRLTDAEYYSGCAASYTNLNWRINTLPKYYWSEAGDDVSAYDNWGSDDKEAMRASFQAFYDEVEKRFGEVMSAALGTLYPDVKMISGIDVIYTVQMMLYTQHIGSGTGKVTHAFEFKLVDTGKFEYVRMYALSPEYELMKDANFE